MCGNINKLHKPSEKCDNQQQYKVVIEAFMVSITKGLTENRPMDVFIKGNLKKTIPRNSTR